MNNTTAKQLAIEFLYNNKILTEKETLLVLSSKYRDALNNSPLRFTGNFDRLVEEIVDQLDASEEDLPQGRSRKDYSEEAHKDILNKIEDKFPKIVTDLFPDWDNIKTDDFKQIIQDYLDNHTVNNQVKSFYNNLLKTSDINEIYTQVLSHVRHSAK